MGGVTLTGIAFASYWVPRLFSSHRMFAATTIAMLSGTGAMLLGLGWSLQVILILGASLVTIGTGLVNVTVGVGCIGMGMRQLGLSITTAYVAAYALRGVFAMLPEEVNLTIFCIAPLAATATVARYARAPFDQMYTEGSPAQVALTAPSSVLPFGHQLFVTLLLFRFIYGFTLTFGEVERIPLLAMAAIVPLAIALAYLVTSKKALSPDALFQLSILCSVAGFLMLSIAGTSGSLVSMLLSCGTGFFEILMYFVLIALGSKNAVVALPMLAWGNAMASWGTLLGANFGRITNSIAFDSAMASAAAALIVFGIVAYVVLVQKTFSFSHTIQDLTPPAPLISAANQEPTASIAQRCKALGSKHSLTDREQEIFEYLARGRNVRFIQEELTVSYNTVKTHVSHIYAKLDVHSHQELIDLVEKS